MELTILMPCLNEEITIGICINKAMRFLKDNGIKGEVLIADNGSSDDSVEIARSLGARVVYEEKKGYGSALIKGTNEARGKYIIMGDADDSYDFENLMPFVEQLRNGYDLVMGNRFSGGIEDGAMPWSHRYIGNPVLSFIGRIFFNSKIKDFHCGLRGYNRQSILNLNLQTTGMEYASEMVVKAELNDLRITEVPTTLKKDGRDRPPHLRSFRDGWRHLKFLLMYAPNWLFLYPGLVLLLTGLGGSLVLLGGQINVLKVTFSINTLLYFMFFIIIGFNIICMFLMVRLYAFNHHFLPEKSINWNQRLNEDVFVFLGIIFVIAGITLSIVALESWRNECFGPLVPEKIMRITIPAVTLIAVGIQGIFTGFIMGILKVRDK